MCDNIQGFVNEQDFEEALTEHLLHHGWNNVLKYKTEEELVQNWADIIYQNNRDRDKLGDYPLTPSEMNQIMEQVRECGSPYLVNKFITGKEIKIKRDHPMDVSHLGKEVYLKIFDPKEISSGQSVYQIVRQPRFRTGNSMLGARRGDMMLLINGMPVIHIELKRSKVDVSQACYQLKRYFHEGVFDGIFSMVQIFVAMTPEETLYFANPGSAEKFSPDFYFHWEDFNNVVVRDWKKVATDLLSIPMAHQMVGYYTISDDKDKTLKVLRSYQYFAASKISDVVCKTNWDSHEHRGGFIWHTTGSGKTMTSFKSAQLIASSGDADKVVFLLDRIELAVQSLDEYRGFAGESDSIQDTADTRMLVAKLKSSDPDDRLIITSIQKMSKIDEESVEEIEKIRSKRLVFIIDECHRSVFGSMLMNIKHTFPKALLFGFTGTPVFEENAKNEITTATIFGDTLHQYTIASGIPDGNVLGFDPYMGLTEKEEDIRELVSFRQIDLYLKEKTDEEVVSERTTAEYMDLISRDTEIKKIYDKFMYKLKMQSEYTEGVEVKKGIESYLPKDFYRSERHHKAVAQDIVDSFERFSRNYKFHAMLTTKSIPEAIAYYKIFKEDYPSLNVVSVFDNNIDNSDEGIAREDSIIEMLTDYNHKYGTTFDLPSYAKYKKDVAKRLAHKGPYVGVETDHSQEIDLLIVVTQMLTGYDSKWVNTLYVDKVMKYVDVIQAFSRTNRVFGPEKPFGIIKYYAYPYTMQQNIEDALEVYVDRPIGVFVDKLETNLSNINQRFYSIRDLFRSHGIMNFEKLPDTRESKNMFAKLFSEMTHLIERAKLQGFRWDKDEYEFKHGDTYTRVKMVIDENTYLILLQRYRELFEPAGGGGGSDPWEYEIDTFITEKGTGTIDAEYIDSKFRRFIKNLYSEGPGSEVTKQALQELCKTFASLSQADQRTALIILHDIQSGDLHLEKGKTIQDYINQYNVNERHQQIKTLSEATGIDELKLRNIMDSDVNEHNLNEFGRFEALKSTLDMQMTKVFLEKILGNEIRPFEVSFKIDKILRQFIFDQVIRSNILKAWLREGLTMETAASDHEDEVTEASLTEVAEERNEWNKDIIKAGVRPVLESNLGTNLLTGMRSMDEILESVLKVIEAESISTLDGINVLLKRAFSNIYCGRSFVDKFVGFNLLATKFEAYLKKLYYLIHGSEVVPQYEGEEASWKDAIHAFNCLWELKYSRTEEKQRLYQALELAKSWRNDESHLSPTASEQELNAAINIIIILYFYVSGKNVTELESSGVM